MREARKRPQVVDLQVLDRLSVAADLRPRLPSKSEQLAIVGGDRENGVERGERALVSFGLDDPSLACSRLGAEQMRRLALALASLGDPDLVVLDDPWESPETVAVIRAARGRGAAVLLTAREPGLLAEHVDGRTLALSEGKPA